MLLVVITPETIPTECLSKLYDCFLKILDSYNVTEIHILSSVPEFFKNFIINLCDGEKYDFCYDIIASPASKYIPTVIRHIISIVKDANLLFIAYDGRRTGSRIAMKNVMSHKIDCMYEKVSFNVRNCFTIHNCSLHENE